MIDVKEFFEALKSNGVDFFTGVPDSLLKNFCSYVTYHVPAEDHIINSNEGAAIALAAGHYLSTGNLSLVYMQNSGLGNAVNPLLSLADPEVYGIPMLLLIGWRGEPGRKDEPQHKKQGRVMLKMLEAMEIPYKKLTEDTRDVKKLVDDVCKQSIEGKLPCAIVVSENTFSSFEQGKKNESRYELSREDAIKIILDEIPDDSVVVSTTGKTSREVFEYREAAKKGHQNDFLTVGSMGHCSQIAMGISKNLKHKKVIILDGDGSLIMHLGSLAIIGTQDHGNLLHIVLNNGAHESVGGQPTVACKIDIPSIARACGYKQVFAAESVKEIKSNFSKMKEFPGPVLMEIKVSMNSRSNLGRPTNSPEENKNLLMSYLGIATQ